MLRFVPVLRLAVLRIIDLLTVVPVLRLLGLGVFDLLGRQEVPVVFETSGLNLLVVDEDFVGAIGVDDEGVQVGEDVVLASDLLLGQEVLALVIEDDMDLLGARTANVRS